MRRILALASLVSAFGASFATAATNGSTVAATQINAILSPVSVEIAADTEKLYESKSSNISRYPIFAAGTPGYMWVALAEGAPTTRTAHCTAGASAAYIFYAAVGREQSGSLDWRHVHAVILGSSDFLELLIRGSDKLIVGPRSPAADSWSVGSESRRIDPLLQYDVEASDSPQPGEIRLTLKAAEAVATQDRMLAKRAMLDEPLICPRPPIRPRPSAKNPIDPDRVVLP